MTQFDFMETFIGYGPTREKAYLSGLRELITIDDGPPTEEWVNMHSVASEMLTLLDKIHDLTQDDSSTREDFINLQGELQVIIGKAALGDQ